MFTPLRSGDLVAASRRVEVIAVQASFYRGPNSDTLEMRYSPLNRATYSGISGMSFGSTVGKGAISFFSTAISWNVTCQRKAR